MTSERNPEGGFMNQKKKNEKSVPNETEYPTTENAGSSSIRQWKKGTTLIAGDSMLAGIEKKNIYPEIGPLKFAFSPAQQLKICMTT